jgi:methionyl-tRNA formyltransferase
LPNDNYDALYNKCLKESYLLGRDLFSKDPRDWPRKEQDIIDNEYYPKRTSNDSTLSKRMSLLEIDRIIRAEGWKGVVSFSCNKRQFTAESHLLSNDVSGYQNGEVMQVSGNKVTLCIHGRAVELFLLKNDRVPEVSTVID